MFPSTLFIKIAIFFGALLTCFLAGHHLATIQERAAALAALQAEQAKYQVQEKNLQAISQQLEESKHARQIVTKTITKSVDKIVTRPIYSASCMDADGLRLANAALTGHAPDTGQPPATLPKPHTP